MRPPSTVTSALVTTPPRPSSRRAARMVTGRSWPAAGWGARKSRIAKPARRMVSAPGKFFGDGMGGPEREGAEGERTVGASRRHAGGRAGNEQVLVIVGAAPGVGDAGRRVVTHPAPARRMILEAVAAGREDGSSTGPGHFTEQLPNPLLARSP